MTAVHSDVVEVPVPVPTSDVKIVLSKHAIQRTHERVAPTFNGDDLRAQNWVITRVDNAHRFNGFTRKPPKWALSKRLPKGVKHRYVKATRDGHDFLIVLSRISAERTVIITVIRNDD